MSFRLGATPSPAPTATPAPQLQFLEQQVLALKREVEKLRTMDGSKMREKDAALEAAQQTIDHLKAVVDKLTETCVAGKEDIRLLTLQITLKENELALRGQTSHPKMGAASVLNGCAKMEEEAKGGICLFIIDPQVDFHEGGALEVEGANEDSTRIASILDRYGHKIERVVVTLDAHHRMHIAHGCFWTNAKGDSPDNFAEIKAEDVQSGKWVPRQPEMREWALEYCQKLEAGNRFTHMIWPEHCLIGTPGHAVSPLLLPALLNWSETHKRNITWVLKGQNNRTEMYSALKAEVEVGDDPTTKLNTNLIATLATHSLVIVCGEAKSHCVNYTLRDLLKGWPSNRKRADLVLMNDGTSPVKTAKPEADKFERDMRTAGVTVANSDGKELKRIFPDSWLIEATSKLQVDLKENVVQQYQPAPDSRTAKFVLEQHDRLYQSILKTMAKTAKKYDEIKATAVERGVTEFDALREWNNQRVKTELAEEIKRVYAPLNNPKPIAMFVVGHSASGKSTFVNKIFLPKERGAFFYINPDVLGQFFCGSNEGFVFMKKYGLMSGDTSNMHTAHADLNDIRFKFVSQTTMDNKKNAVLDSNTVPPEVVEAWRTAGYDVQVAFVEASYQGVKQATDENEKIELKVQHGLANDEKRVRKGAHSNAGIITVKRLKDCRKAAAKLHRELGIEVHVYISSGDANKERSGYLHLGKLGGKGLELPKDEDDEFGFYTPKEVPDGHWLQRLPA